MSNLDKLRQNCFRCKGNSLLCHPPRCPMRTKLFSLNKARSLWQNRTKLDGINPPSFFVSSKTYPKVNITPMISLDTENTIIDEPDAWKTTYQIPEIVRFRTHLIRAQGRRVDARAIENLQDKVLESSQELVLASNSVSMSVELEKPLDYQLSFSRFRQPVGPVGNIKKLTLEDTPKIDQKVDYITSDTDLIAKQGIVNLYNSDLTVTRITRILSAGMLGIQGQRKLVPTRWSITATDDQIGLILIEKIKNYPEINEIQIFESFYLDNHFITILIPNQWSFELLEAWEYQTHQKISGDFETTKGRSYYASNTAGGYYAARLAVLEYLTKIHKQARVYCLRKIGDGYYIPLGVWAVRENVRSGFNNGNCQIFDDKQKAFTYASDKLKIPLKAWLNASQLIKYKSRQLSLESYLVR